jgi:hypothetical protein
MTSNGYHHHHRTTVLPLFVNKKVWHQTRSANYFWIVNNNWWHGCRKSKIHNLLKTSQLECSAIWCLTNMHEIRLFIKTIKFTNKVCLCVSINFHRAAKTRDDKDDRKVQDTKFYVLCRQRKQEKAHLIQ